MKSNRTIIISILIFLCLICLVISGIGYFYLSNQPPSPLSDSGYYVRGSTIYYHPGFGLSEPFEITEADRDSFVILDQRYALDSSYVFYGGVFIVGADPSTFEVLASPFSRDAKHVYASGTIFSDDPVNFERLSENVSRDSQHIYWSGNSISDDPAHLVMLGSSGFYTYLKDSTTIFIQGNPIQDADLATFAMITDAYSRDVSHIFYFDQTIPAADSASFEIIESPYARDTSNVYFMEHVLPDADRATFVVLNVKFQCSADATHAYYQGALIPDFDPASIPPDNTVTNCDENGIYFSP